jgi:TPR repeat protein
MSAPCTAVAARLRLSFRAHPNSAIPVSAFKALPEPVEKITEKSCRRLPIVARAALVTAVIALCPSFVCAGPCDLTWDGEKVAQIARGRNPALGTQLLGNNKQVVAELTGAQILAISEAKDAIASELGRSPSLLFCSDEAPNAFAMNTPNGEVVGVTIGLAKLMNGDRDMAAMVIGHEYAHLVLGHLAAAEQRREFLTLLGAMAGVFLEAKIQTKTNVQGLGMNVGLLSTSLISYKFDRDQERQADAAGFRYMVDAGFNPLGAVRLAEIMQRYGAGGIGLFFDNHPGWPERTARFQALIKASPTAQATIARTGARTALASASIGAGQAQVALAPIYETSNAEKMLADGIAALGKQDFQTALTAIRSSAATGYAPAQRVLGYLYGTGSAGLPKDEVEAVRLYRLAAAQSDAYAMNNLGWMYQVGRGGLSVDEVEAVRLYRLAVAQSNTAAMNNLGWMYERGRGGLSVDEVEAVRLYREAANHGNPQAVTNLGAMYMTGRGGLSVDEVEAVRLYREAANQGDPEALNNLGTAYLLGSAGVAKNEITAKNYYQRAADAGNGDALAALGYLYQSGWAGLEKDIPKAIALYRQSADKGSAVGRFHLAECYEIGIGEIQKDEVEAVKWLQMAADQGWVAAENDLGVMYYRGAGGLPKSATKAAELYKLAADGGYALAQSNLGWMYLHGEGGLPRDSAEAARLFQLSAAQGNAFAQANLGSMYLDGEGGLSRSPTEALRLFRLSAAQGNPLGQFNLGAMYEFGDAGLPKDKETAVNWYRKAAAQGLPSAAKALSDLHVN